MGEEEREKKAATELAELLELLGLEGKKEIELEDVELSVGELVLQPSALAATVAKAVAPPVPLAPPKVKPTTILEAPFTPFVQEYPGQIREVTLGATKSEGGDWRRNYPSILLIREGSSASARNFRRHIRHEGDAPEGNKNTCRGGLGRHDCVGQDGS